MKWTCDAFIKPWTPFCHLQTINSNFGVWIKMQEKSKCSKYSSELTKVRSTFELS